MAQIPELSSTCLHFRRKIAASPETLWHYISTAEGLACWQADEVRGSVGGGNFSLRWPGLGARLDLSVERSSDPHSEKRLILRAGATRVELSVGEDGVALTHGGLDPSDDLSGFESSWETALRLLEIAATHHPKKSRRVHWLFSSVETKAELLQHFFTDKHALGSWLGATEADLATDQEFSLKLFGGDILTGTALYTARDVCLRIHELEEGVVTFRSLPGPQDKRMVAIAVSTWNRAAPHKLIQALEGALRRLQVQSAVKHS